MGRTANYEIEKTAQLLYFPTINTKATGERISSLLIVSGMELESRNPQCYRCSSKAVSSAWKHSFV